MTDRPVQPNPGMDEAIRDGCICPPMAQQPIQNKYHHEMLVEKSCPIHGWGKPKDTK